MRKLLAIGSVSERPKVQLSKSCVRESAPWVQIPPGPPCDVARHRKHLNPRVQVFLSFLGLVIAACVEGEFSEEFACLLVNNTDFYSVDEHDDAGVFVVSADSDVVHFACVAE